MTSRNHLLLLLLPVLLLAGCSADDHFLAQDPAAAEASVSDKRARPKEPNQVVGLSYAVTKKTSVDMVFTDLTARLAANENIGIVAEIDHAANAASVGRELRPTSVVLFGNPNLGTPLMQLNPRAGLDLPQKILVYQTNNKRTITAYNGTAYLGSRHGVEDAPTLPMIAGALHNLTATVSGSEVAVDEGTVERDAGIRTVPATGAVDEVYARLRAVIDGNPNLRIIAELDHQANAARVGLELSPIRLIVFGNPNLGTPLMREAQSVGIDLPQKMLVYQTADGGTEIIWNDPFFLAGRHGIPTTLPQLSTIAGALINIANAATQP